MLKTLSFVGAIVLTLPLFTLLPAQAVAQTTTPTHCPHLSQTMQRGTRDSTTIPRGQVTQLQRFLSDYYDLNPADYVTGFFGRLTQTNVRKFQCEKMQICSGAENSTGWGMVGAKTRAAIRKACGAQTTTTTTKSSTQHCTSNPPRPKLSCDGKWEKFFNQNQCHIGWTCVVTQSVSLDINKAPLISAIIGPTLLKPNVSGAWKISARDPENDALVYSVIWGDEGRYVAQLLNIAQEGTPYRAATTISHTYKNTGAYAIVVFAKDTGGNIVKATLSIGVYKTSVYKKVPPPITIGGRVRATAKLNVRSSPSILGSILGQQAKGSLGTVIGGPTTAGGYTWWKINWNSDPDGWSVQDYLKKAATTDTNATKADIDAALQSASQTLEKANKALLDANNSVIVANSLRTLPGTLPGAAPILEPLITTAKNSAAAAVKNAQRAVSIARKAYTEAMAAVQLAGQGKTKAASAAAKKASDLAGQSLAFSSVAEKFVDNVNLIKRLLSAAVLRPGGI